MSMVSIVKMLFLRFAANFADCPLPAFQTFSSLPPAEFAVLRQTLLRFFQDRRVKVSLFLQDQVQYTRSLLRFCGGLRLGFSAAVDRFLRCHVWASLSGCPKHSVDNCSLDFFLVCGVHFLC